MDLFQFKDITLPGQENILSYFHLIFIMISYTGKTACLNWDGDLAMDICSQEHLLLWGNQLGLHGYSQKDRGHADHI